MNCIYVAKLLKDYWQMVINNEEDIIVYLCSEAVKYTVHEIRWALVLEFYSAGKHLQGEYNILILSKFIHKKQNISTKI